MNSEINQPSAATENFGKARRITPSLFGTIAIVFYTYAVLSLLLLHVLRPDYTLRTHMISDYAVGRYGWVMTTWFIAMSSGCLMLVFGLAGSGLKTVWFKIGAGLMCVASIGLVISALFPTDLEEATSTQTGNIHAISFFINIVSIIFSAAFLTVGFRSHPLWRSFQGTAVVLTLLVFIAFFIQFFTLHRGAPYGLTNRLFVVVLFAWFLITSMRLRRLPG
ncbi:MAG TPA: DUF998 domain-containing protein [Puia sp.]